MSKDFKDVRQMTQYLDGLGRLLQYVIKKGSYPTGGSAVDMVSAIEYDEFGRRQFQYLPFTANNAGSNTSITDGNFKFNPFLQQQAFMQSRFGAQYETFFYGQKVFEASPQNRIQTKMEPGNSWIGAGRGTTVKNWFNTTTDSVRIWTVTDVANDWGTYSSPGAYMPGALYKRIVTDVHNKQVIEFTDNQGQIILKKEQLTAAVDTGTGKGYYGWICTYFIYDVLGNLRCVVQPKGVELLIQNSWNINAQSGAILNEQSFRYEYDRRNRMTMKKMPGMGESYMVYDKRDRMVLLQDKNLRDGSPQKWAYIQYDNLNRPVSSGLWNNSNARTYHADRADTSIAYPNLSGQTFEELTTTFYDNYSWRSQYGNPLSATLNTDNSSYLLAASNSIWPYPQTVAHTNNVDGAVTGTRCKILGTSTYLYAVRFYDNNSRLIQVQSTNVSGETDVVTTQYGWFGLPLIMTHQTKKNAPVAQTIVMLTRFTYDDHGRMIKLEKKTKSTLVNSGAMPTEWTTILSNEYDALNKLKKTKIGRIKDGSGNYTSTPIDSLTYEYNIHGWLLGMNRDYVKDTNSVANYFGFDLGYNKDTFFINSSSKLYSDKQYNGNIAGTVWKSNGDDRTRKYDFLYDATNRLNRASFTQLTNNNFNVSAGIDFSTYGITYDANGNITTLNQKGWKPGGSVTIDSLLYTYIDYTNRLKNVWDRTNDVNTKLGDFRSSSSYMTALGGTKTTGATDYFYDNNGNLVKDLNRDISDGVNNGVVYNFMGLPQTVYVNGKGSIDYVYDAGGLKLKKVTHETAKPDRTTLYSGGGIYENDTLQYLGHEEGRIRYNAANPGFVYDYFIKDHLGNVRVVVTEEQRLDQYPAATFEDATLSQEQLYYDSVTQERVARPGSFFNSTTNGNYVQLLRKSTQSVGVGKLMKIMAFDKLHVRVDYYTPNDATNNNNADGKTSVLAALLGLLDATGAPSLLKGSGSVITSGLNAASAFSTFMGPQGTGTPSSDPKAYLNILFFDEQFNFVQDNSEIIQITTKGSGQQIFRVNGNAKTASKNGFVYIFVSNESENFVYFDNFQITHERGALLEESHYYPFGLSMTGISSRAVGNIKNKFRFNGNVLQSEEFSDGSGLEIMDFNARTYDQQIGRFIQVDPLAEWSNSLSPYTFARNNPIVRTDVTGMKDTVVKGETMQRDKDLPEVIFTAKRINHKASPAGFDHSKMSKEQFKVALGIFREKFIPKRLNDIIKFIENGPGLPIRELQRQAGMSTKEIMEWNKIIDNYKTIYGILMNREPSDINPLMALVPLVAEAVEKGSGAAVGMLVTVVLSQQMETWREEEERDLLTAHKLGADRLMNHIRMYNKHYASKGYGYQAFYMRAADLNKLIACGYLDMETIMPQTSYQSYYGVSDNYLVYFRTSLLKYPLIKMEDVGYIKSN